MDQFIEGCGNKIHIYSYGEGAVPVVFLSGSGVPFPQLEYLPFQKELSGFCKVVGIEKPGYGRSDVAAGERLADPIVDEYREALHGVGITGGVVLAAHSMGFLEALRWGQRYPEEVLGILGIDPATPECYEEFDLQKATSGLIELFENESLRKNVAAASVEQMMEDGLILPGEKEEYLALAQRNFANENWISEAKHVKDTLQLIKKNQPYLQVPMLFFISNGEGTTIGKASWLGYAKQYLSKIENSRYETYDYPHNLYRFAYKEMAQKASEFVAELTGR